MENIILVKNDGKTPDIDDELMTITNTIKYDMYKPCNNTLAIYEYMKKLFVKNDFPRTIILSEDISIASSVITGLAEKTSKGSSFTDHEGKQRIIYESDLRVFYFGNSCRLGLDEFENHLDFRKSVISNSIGISGTFTNHNVNINPKNVYMFVSEVDEEEKTIIDEYEMELYQLDMLRKKDFGKILKHICDDNKYYPVSIIFDLDILMRINKDDNIMSIDELDIVLENINNLTKIMSINISSYTFIKDNPSNKYQCEIILKIIETFEKIKKNRINIFSDDSKFLIWRKENDESYGWYILRGVSLDFKNKILESIDDNSIIQLEIDDHNCMIACTSIKDQNSKTYYGCNSVYDLCLYPDEKVNMVFEMITKYE